LQNVAYKQGILKDNNKPSTDFF